ncbi:class I SAM-dependent methyltransferase [Tengunoibacter tsumagoiensis]|uniref:Methyltransferase domain-containing protein n=1 Tax=Tengunoibacter tsumagoiensis TaxID=2014871 RepID=A0A401ZZI6_9CHLR|nr:class I SAM-dependent methyltransferase [Tengunoibacter tsumagoiensis]GCE12264.1 hypothetical protein KTT_21230 [Tengunoibacter tsumagoiensis]
MQPKPESYSTYYAETFKNQQVVEAYRHRPPYPAETFTILRQLLLDEPRVLLDVGAGAGDLARKCVAFADRVDAVDFSQTMIDQGKQLSDGDHPRLRWIYGKIEEVPLSPPYALITAGSSIHWTEWSQAFPRFRSLLTPHGFVAIVGRRVRPMPWDGELSLVQNEYALRKGHQPARIVDELSERGYFQQIGRQETAPIPFEQPLEDFIAGLHSRSNFARERMGEERASAFDQRVREILQPYLQHGQLVMQVVGTVVWGKPEDGHESGTRRNDSPRPS